LSHGIKTILASVFRIVGLVTMRQLSLFWRGGKIGTRRIFRGKLTLVPGGFLDFFQKRILTYPRGFSKKKLKHVPRGFLVNF